MSFSRAQPNSKPAADSQNPEQFLLFPLGLKLSGSPEKELHPWPAHLPLPRVGVLEWVSLPNGDYRPMIHTHDAWIRMTETVLDELGLGVKYDTMRRLMRAGFVESRQIAPGNYSFSLKSWFRHCEAVKADPEFWGDAKKYRRYQEAL